MRKKTIQLCATAALFAALILPGCRIRPRARTLPEAIQNVYVPMYVNSTYEPGLEELAARATVEAILADGRLDVVSEPNADVVVQGIIMKFDDASVATESDDWSMINEMTVRVKLKLYSPNNRLEPIYEYKPFTVSASYVSDARRMTQTIPGDAKKQLMDTVGRRAALELLTGRYFEPEPLYPAEERNLEEGS